MTLHQAHCGWRSSSRERASSTPPSTNTPTPPEQRPQPAWLGASRPLCSTAERTAHVLSLGSRGTLLSIVRYASARSCHAKGLARGHSCARPDLAIAPPHHLRGSPGSWPIGASRWLSGRTPG